MYTYFNIVDNSFLYVGNSKAEVKINVPETIVSGQLTHGSCVASGEIYSRTPPTYILVKLVGSDTGCKISNESRFQIRHAPYQRNFSITCNGSSSSVGMQCFTDVNNEFTQGM